MRKRIDNIVNELTNCIEEQIQTEVEMALGVRRWQVLCYKVFCAMKDAVAGRGIELLAIPKQMKIEENHAE